MQLTDNARAFIGAAALMTVLSLGVFFSGILPGRGDGDGIVEGEATVTPAVLESTATPDPTPAPSPGEPMSAPIELPILMYHRVGTPPEDDPMNARLTVTPSDLEAQLAYLECAGFTTITVERLYQAFMGTARLPDNPVILTFDDGWADHYTEVFPRLRAHGMTGSFAIVTGFVESGGPYLTWPQVQEMAAAGMEILSHSVSHSDLGAQADAAVSEELTSSKSALEAHTGHRVAFFVYPAGEPFRSGTPERQARVVQMLQDAGYEGALLAVPWSTTQDPAHPFELNRVRVDGGEDIYSFAASVGGPDPDSLSC